MSVVWIGRWKGQDDADAQSKGHDEAAAKIAQLSRDNGCLHHEIYRSNDTNEGFVVDEWETREGLETFLNAPEFASALQEAGFSPPDEIIVLDKVPGDAQYRW